MNFEDLDQDTKNHLEAEAKMLGEKILANEINWNIAYAESSFDHHDIDFTDFVILTCLLVEGLS